MYKIKGRIRYSELDSEGKLSLESLLDYFQDCSTFHSEEIGVGLKYLQERHLAWVMSAWQIIVERYPAFGERVLIGTAPYDFKGFMGWRNFLMETEEGERLAYANTVWTLMDMEHMRPARVPKEMTTAYVLEGKLDMDYAPRKIAIPEIEGQRWEDVEVRHHHLDTNHHVNNGQYIRIAMEYLPEGFEIRQMRAEYKKQAVLGDVIVPVVYRHSDNICLIALNNKEGQAYCIAEFKGMECRNA
ncbi:MAG: acyl-[acyl-carrier-protein] thioesterase [Clostridiales bacterium]|nr:acyl-[acyl-carrier-protein] thioesterase [Clostridiales bacterium]